MLSAKICVNFKAKNMDYLPNTSVGEVKWGNSETLWIGNYPIDNKLVEFCHLCIRGALYKVWAKPVLNQVVPLFLALDISLFKHWLQIKLLNVIIPPALNMIFPRKTPLQYTKEIIK